MEPSTTAAAAKTEEPACTTSGAVVVPVVEVASAARGPAVHAVCAGHGVLTPDLPLLVLTLGAILAVDGAFARVLVLAPVTMALPAFGAVAACWGLCVLGTLAALLRTALMDPGILPRGSAPPGREGSSPLVRHVLMNGQPVALKYCRTCHLWRPPRCVHCARCNNCVDSFDHHCPWIGNCIGRRNYRWFLVFLVCALCNSVFNCALAVFVFVGGLFAWGGDRADAVRFMFAHYWDIALSALVCAAAALWLATLCAYHAHLLASGTTTNEDLKGRFPHGTPFALGSGARYCATVLFGPLPPSFLVSS